MVSTKVVYFETTIYPTSTPGHPATSQISAVTATLTAEGDGKTIPPHDAAGGPLIIPSTATNYNGLFVTVPSSDPKSQVPESSKVASIGASISSPASSPSTAPSSNSASSNTNTLPRSDPPQTTGSSTSPIDSSSKTPGPQVPRHTSTSNSIGPGAAAGIGIGCAIAGALIAAAILALLFRRRRRRSPARSDVIPLNGYTSAEKSVASPQSSSPAGLIERNLPQPVEDQALGGEMSRLRTSIKNHVQSYYHTNSIGRAVDSAALGLVAAGNMPLIASTLGTLLSNPATRLTAIRFCIAWVAVSRIEQNCEPNSSFLPPEIANCLVSIAGAREEPSSKFASHSCLSEARILMHN